MSDQPDAVVGEMNEDDAGGFLPIAAAPHTPPRWREAVARSQQQAGPRPLAVVLPGTMGSSLSAGGRPVWLHYLALLRGGLTLAVSCAAVSARTLA